MTKQLTIDDFAWHPLAKRWPLSEGDKFADLRRSVKERGGNIYPILFRIVDIDGQKVKQYLDGRSRMKACLEEGVDLNEQRVFVDEQALPQFIRDCNNCRRHEDEEARAEQDAMIARFTQAGLSTRTIAEKVGVHQSTVSRTQKRQRKSGDARPASPEEDAAEGAVPAELPDILGRDGKGYKRKKAEPSKPRPAPVKAGEVLFNWKDWDALMGQLARGVDQCKDACLAAGKEDFKDLRKKFLALDDALRGTFNAHNGKGAKAPAPRWKGKK